MAGPTDSSRVPPETGAENARWVATSARSGDCAATARSRRLWVVSELYYPEETSTGYYMTGIAEGLAQHFQVRVLCAQPTYSLRGTRAPRREMHRAVEIRRIRSTTLSNQRMAARLINLVTITVAVLISATLRFRRGDLVLVESTPPSLPFAVAFACLVRRAACVVLIHDAYPDVPVAAGFTRADSLLARLTERANRVLYGFATRIVVLGRGMQERAQARLPAALRSKVMVIRSWADTEMVRAEPREGSALLEKLGLSDKFVVQYAGNISRLNGIETLADTIEQLADEPEIHFLIVGRGGRRDWLQNEIERRSLTNVTMVDWLPRSESPKMHRACDVVLVPLIPGMGGAAVPSRLYNALASGRPIIAATEAVSELARIVEEEEVGWVVSPGDAGRLVQAIREAAGDRSRLIAMGSRARAAAERRFSRQQTLARWVQLFEDLDEGRATPAEGG